MKFFLSLILLLLVIVACSQSTALIYDNNGNIVQYNQVSECSGCSDIKSISGFLTENQYQANQSVLSNGTILASVQTRFNAEQCIELKSGFTVSQNAEFEARIEPCSIPGQAVECVDVNYICDLAISIEESGTYTVSPIDNGMGTNKDGTHARWFKYTANTSTGPEIQGLCDNDTAESVTIFKGSCDNLEIHSKSCGNCPGTSNCSGDITFFVTIGETYFIHFDDKYGQEAFEFYVEI